MWIGLLISQNVGTEARRDSNRGNAEMATKMTSILPDTDIWRIRLLDLLKIRKTVLPGHISKKTVLDRESVGLGFKH